MFQWLKSFNLNENNLRNFLEKAKSVGDIASQIAEVDAQIEALMKKKESLAAARAEAEKEILSFDHSKLFAQALVETPAISEEAQGPVAEEKPVETAELAPKRAVAISVPEFLALPIAAAKEEPAAVSEDVQESAAETVAEKPSEHDFVTTPAAFFATRRTLRTSNAQQGGEVQAQNAPVSMSEFLNS